MHKTRLEAFSDGVIAILITIMVLELYWNNHHHLFHVVEHVTGGMLWANLHLLFWLSLVPFVTNWMGEHPHEPLPTATYGVVMLCAAVAYFILVRVIIHAQGSHSMLRRAVGNDFKGTISPMLYVAGIGSFVALIWLVPDKRIERVL
jgi:uncharacterized membrane protein